MRYAQIYCTAACKYDHDRIFAFLLKQRKNFLNIVKKDFKISNYINKFSQNFKVKVYEKIQIQNVPFSMNRRKNAFSHIFVHFCAGIILKLKYAISHFMS